MITVTPAEVPQLIPGAPADVTDGHLTLAALWVAQRLTERNVSDAALTEPQALAARTALAAKALEVRSALTGGVTRLQVAAGSTSGGALESIKLPGLELKLGKTTTTDGAELLDVAATTWATLAEQLLAYALPAAPRRVLFPGAAR
ncbi:hypothetical protein GCM10008959_25220 [Deinococcus seoulensis]|uniref:Uncharacterized protein n=1 Tax=Deinococcus seoulensis TaxID=1837379 RepID=A0ABQ2RV19_9DEIO|nr:hypothetical protein [Deinococcus seoulensis]GGR62226.1 hypothetical protein GCM10008959_25220 [Deinococcus seoulensis]